MNHWSECKSGAEKRDFLKAMLEEDFARDLKMFEKDDATYRTAVVLLSSLIVGPDRQSTDAIHKVSVGVRE